MNLTYKKIVLFLIVSLVLTLSVSTALAAPEYDFGGRTITIHSNWLKMEREYGEDGFTAGAGKAHLEKVEEDFNVNIEFYLSSGGAAGAIDSIITGVLSGDPDADIYNITTSWIDSSLGPEGVLYPLNNVLDQDYYDSLPDIFREPPHIYKGNVYAFRTNLQIDSGEFITWNKSLFEREGLHSIYDLVDEGNWTWETFKDLAVEITKDTDGDGEIDQWGIRVLQGKEPGFVISNGGHFAEMIDGIVQVTYDSPEVIEAYEFMNELIELGVVHATEWRPPYREVFNSGVIGMTIAGTFSQFRKDSYLEMEDDFGIAPYPAGPSSDGEPSTWKWNVGGWQSALPLTINEDPRAVIEVANALGKITDDYYTKSVEQQFIEEYGYRFRDQRSIDNYLKFSQTFIPAPYYIHCTHGQPENAQEILQDIMLGNRAAAPALAEMKPASQALLDELFNE